ncbi:hypothetical protein SOVF_091590 [Spinacia oleracea]|nr:hypothetical protein SOVF_091590 [Spinacia oleracea]
MPEFFTDNSASKNPNVYKYYRNAIVKNFRSNPSKKLTFTEVRRWLVGDVGSIRRVFDFLDTWGLINYSPPSGKPPFKWEEKEKEKETAKANAAAAAASPASQPSTGAAVVAAANSNVRKSNKLCSGCKVACTIACFVCDKYDLVLCARCYVRGNYQVGVNSSEFRRVEINEPVKTDWTEKETLQLLEAVMHYRDDWKRVAEHVGGRTDKECVARFIKLPFREKFAEPGGIGEDQVDSESGIEPPAKRMHLTPLADASNPIMAQAAFLSALAGIEAYSIKVQDPAVESSGGSVACTPEEARVEAESLLKQEEDEFLKSIAIIIEAKMKEIQDKIDRFEEKDLQLEREWHQLRQMQHQLYLDKLTLLFHKTSAPKSVENVSEGNVRTEFPTSS